MQLHFVHSKVKNNKIKLAKIVERKKFYRISMRSYVWPLRGNYSKQHIFMRMTHKILIGPGVESLLECGLIFSLEFLVRGLFEETQYA